MLLDIFSVTFRLENLKQGPSQDFVLELKKKLN